MASIAYIKKNSFKNVNGGKKYRMTTDNNIGVCANKIPKMYDKHPRNCGTTAPFSLTFPQPLSLSRP